MVRVISSNALSSMVITVLLDSAQNVHIAGYSNTESTYNNSTQDLLWYKNQVKHSNFTGGKGDFGGEASPSPPPLNKVESTVSPHPPPHSKPSPSPQQ